MWHHHLLVSSSSFLIISCFGLNVVTEHISSIQKSAGGQQTGTATSTCYSSPTDFLVKREGLSRRSKLHYVSGPYQGVEISVVNDMLEKGASAKTSAKRPFSTSSSELESIANMQASTKLQRHQYACSASSDGASTPESQPPNMICNSTSLLGWSDASITQQCPTPKLLQKMPGLPGLARKQQPINLQGQDLTQIKLGGLLGDERETLAEALTRRIEMQLETKAKIEAQMRLFANIREQERAAAQVSREYFNSCIYTAPHARVFRIDVSCLYSVYCLLCSGDDADATASAPTSSSACRNADRSAHAGAKDTGTATRTSYYHILRVISSL